MWWYLRVLRQYLKNVFTFKCNTREYCHNTCKFWSHFNLFQSLWWYHVTILTSITLAGEHKYWLVMGRTPFYWTLIELEHHFLNIEQTRTCSSNTLFWLWTIEHRTSNLLVLSLYLLNYSPNWLEHIFSNIERTQIFGFERSNLEHCLTHH